MRRVLHVMLGGIGFGGVETWVMNILRHINREKFHVDVLVLTDQPCVHDAEVRSLGSKIIPCLGYPWPWAFGRNFMRVLRQHGPYDVVHSHHRYYTGYVLRLAHRAGVPMRIANNHDPLNAPGPKPGLVKRLLFARMKRWAQRYATVGIANSRESMPTLFGPNWQSDPRCKVIHCGLDFRAFHAKVSRPQIRQALGIPDQAFVAGNVARFVPVKNHTFIVEIAAELARLDPSVVVLLVGGGPLRPAIEDKVQRLGLKERVIFAGEVPDTAPLFLGAMDLFLFPSLFEGFGLVLVEAQAAGLPCVLSDEGVPKEADVIPPLARRVSLRQPAVEWARAIIEMRQSRPPISQREALAAIEASDLNIANAVASLEHIYGA